MADEYEYKDPNTDIMKALSKAVDAATGETGTQYEYKNPDTDVIQKLEELTEAIANSGGGGGGGHNYSTTEQVIGTWIDGKTVYEQVIEFSSPIDVSYNSWTSTTIENIYGTIIDCVGISGTGSSLGSLMANIGGVQYLQLLTPRNSNLVTVAKLIIRYTKSST